MTNSAGHRGPARSWPAERAVLSGQIPPLAYSWIPREETGLSLATLPPSQTTILAAADDAVPASLRGRGGTGKTHLAAALAREYLDQEMVRLVLWVTATSQDAVICSYARALRDVGMPVPGDGPESAASQFLDWLATTGQPWLVVLDDLSDAATLEGFWPRGAAGRVLVTTGLQDIGQLRDSSVVPVGTFSPREALWYLSERLRGDRDQRIGAPDLANELGLLPIALGQAAAVMAETGMDCRQYCALIAERTSQLAADPADKYASIAATWSLSAEFADQLPPAGLARRALNLISMLGPYGIPGALLTSDAACTYLAGSRASFPADETQARRALYNLLRAGLVTIDDSSPARTVLVHELVQTITRQNLSAAERDQAAQAAGDALVQTWSSPGVPTDVAQSLRDCTARLHEIANTALWRPECHPVLVRAGESLVSSGCSGAAVAYWRKMLGISQRNLGPEHPRTVLFRDYLGTASAASEHAGDAIAMYQDVLSDLENTRAGCDPAVLAARASLARAYRAADRPGDAVNLTEYTVAECERVLGASHLETLAARGNLADSYLAAGRPKEAIGLCKRALADRERLQGPDHPDTIAARVSLASAYRAANKIKDAIKHYERALADGERKQEPGQTDIINTRRELALAYLLAGTLAYSVAQYELALAACHQMLGPDHPLTRETQEDLDTVAAHAVSKLGIDLRTPKRLEPFADLLAAGRLRGNGRRQGTAGAAGRDRALACTGRVSTMMGVPTNYLLLAEHERFAKAALSSLRQVIVGGAPMPRSLLQVWLDRGVTVLQGYGLTEAAPNVLCVPPEHARRKAGSAGRPYLHVQVGLRDLASAALVEGPGAGELVVVGPNVFAGCWRNPAATKAAVRDGWLATGDVAERDADGFYRIRGRLKEMYISGGENVYPAEVESVLTAHEAIAEEAVIGVPHQRWGEAGLAFIVPRPGCTVPPAERLAEYCRASLAAYKVPAQYRIMAELPRLSTGKVDKQHLAVLGRPQR